MWNSAQKEEGLHTYDIPKLEKKREKLQLGAALGGGHSQRRIGRGSMLSGFVAWIPLTSLCYLSFNVLN
ncbi:hypothetical protein O9H85_25095 [Paenibacillus filicis]|uniref:Uncharacterized protein n=1 Tax=Paenibacillus gyeongsangnamensis TaxID=3388067 RepID=A0ABT4QFJ0_9BACL|nr:hypothetical protein [Paenibacillus filicis]MCZ8515626.1 hypothetical protein [Paenibacillus filicis]